MDVMVGISVVGFVRGWIFIGIFFEGGEGDGGGDGDGVGGGDRRDG